MTKLPLLDISDFDGRVFAKGLAGIRATVLRAVAGRHTDQLPDGAPHEVIHRDDLVILPS